MASPMTAYAELQVTSNFSFLRGGSHPEELVLRAAELGLAAIALTDRNTLAGVVRAHVAAKEVGIRFVVGARLDLEPGSRTGPLSMGSDADAMAPFPGIRASGEDKRRRSGGAQRRPTAALVTQSDGGSAELPTLPSSSKSESGRGPVDDVLTIHALGSAHAMVGVRAPAPGEPWGSDSDHSPRHGPAMPGLGERRVNVATAVVAAQGRKTANAANTAVDFGQTAFPSSGILGLDPKVGAAMPHAEPPILDGMAPRPVSDRKDLATPRVLTALPALSGPDTRYGRPVNDSSTTRSSGSASHAMVGVRAPAPGEPQGSDSDHSPRHGPTMPGLGERRVNVATAISDVAGQEASSSADVAANFNPTGSPPSCSGSLGASASRAERAAPAGNRGHRIFGSALKKPGHDQNGGARENESGDDRGRSADISENASSDAINGYSLLCFPTDRAAYGRLAQLISLGQRRAEKGGCRLWLEDVLAYVEGQIVVVLPPERIDGEFAAFLNRLRKNLSSRYYLAAQHLYRSDDAARMDALAALAERCGTPLVATGDVLYHAPARRPLQDVLTCIRAHCTVDEAGYRLEANAERHLKPGAEIARLFECCPDALARTLEIADACRFSLDELRYEYPIDPAPAGMSVQAYLEQLTWAGAVERYPDGVPDKVRSLLEHEFALIAELGYAPYFLTVHDIVRFARSRGILCQGRGSAANSAICYCLGITAVDPERFDLLFERFVSAERNEPPDIDVDFEHERREEVIQYIYAKYGRAHAGIAATVIHYRSRSAIREVGKALGLSEDAVSALASGIWGWSEGGLDARLARERGLDPTAPRLSQALELAGELVGFPRHLSQHVGGFVLTRSRLDQVVPVVNAAMADRTIVEWDKDDLDALGILKIDVLALGMLTCVRKAFELLGRHYDRHLSLATVPPEDPAVYEMLSRADSIGVFQVESRAQMTMLPRLRPRCFYDLVIEVAIVRPGPIQGDMVHPYLRRRSGLETVSYPSEALQGVLEKTLGVPLFQEQAMQIAIVGAGFAPSEADRLRRAMATFKRVGTIHTFRGKFIDGMVENGYERAFAERCFKQIEGFGTYGFPESHAASFALLVYLSSWLKCHYPEVFACALLNSQPMGFYAPAQIVRDAQDHGITVLPVDVNASDWDCTLEPAPAAASQSGRMPRLASEPHHAPAGGRPGEHQGPTGFSLSSGSTSDDAIVRDPRDHGISVLPVGVNGRDWDCTLKLAPAPAPQSGQVTRSPSEPHPHGREDPGKPRQDTASLLSSGSTSSGSVNDLSTIGVSRSASHAMLGVRAPASKPSRRSDSEHSPRHDPDVPSVGKPRVNAATAISNAERPEAPGIVMATPDRTAAGSARTPSSHADGAASNPKMACRVLGSGHRVLGSGQKMPEGDEKVSGDATAAPDGRQTGHENGKVGASRRRALRLGFRQVKGVKQEEMARLVARRAGGYADHGDLRRRAEVSAAALDRLARADAFASLALDRRGAVWRAIGLDRTGHELDLPPLFAWAQGRAARPEAPVALPPMTLGQEVAEDYASLRLTLRCHPLALLRPWLARRVIQAERLTGVDDGRRVEVAGLVLVRQRPGTASGVIFITIEDESGIANLVVWPAVFERFRRVVLGAQLMVVRGKVQKEGLVIHVVADTLIDRTDLLRRLAETKHAFEAPVARADRVKRPNDSGQRPRRRSASSPPFEAPIAHADHAKNSGPPDPRDPGHLSRRQRLLAKLGKPETPVQSPLARADERKRQVRNLLPAGFKSRDFH